MKTESSFCANNMAENKTAIHVNSERYIVVSFSIAK
jgi:hypothetical protein